MILKNINNYTHQELQDVITQVKAHMQLNELEEAVITLANYQEQEEDGRYYYEIYNSLITIDSETTLEEAFKQQIESEDMIKEYKTKKGLLQAFINDKDIEGSYYRVHTQI